jgi:hypothetical protein
MNGHGKVLNVLGILALVLLRAVEPTCEGWNPTPGCGGSSGGPPPGFRISLNPATLTVRRGSTGTTTLTIVPQNGFSGTVFLFLEGPPLPCADPTARCGGVNISPQSVNVPGPGPVEEVLTISVDDGVAPGTYDRWLRASSGRISDSARLVLQVTGP